MKINHTLIRGLLCPLVALAVCSVNARTYFSWSAAFDYTEPSPPQTNFGYVEPSGDEYFDKDTTVQAYANPGYRFMEWDVENGQKAIIGGFVSTDPKFTFVDGKASQLVVVAYFTYGIYTVTFDANGGTLTGSPKLTVTNNQTYANIPSVSRTGYTFGGWTTNNVDWSVENGDRVWLTQDTTAKAKWTESTATLTYNANGHGAAPAAVTMNYSAATTAASALSATGYTFNGWNTQANGLGTKYAAGDTVKAANVIPSAMTLYAQWTEKTAKLTYDANGHGTAPDAVTMKYSAAMTAASKLGATGYTFNGWNTQANGSGTDYAAGDTVKAANVEPSAMTLYAQWTANNYTVSFHTQGGSSVSEKTVTYDSTYGDLPTTTRAGYIFDGWFTSPSGSNEVTKDTIVKATQGHTLYAHWTAKKYTISFEANEGVVAPTSKTVDYDGDYGDLPKPTREGYDFLGWYTDQTGGDRKYSTTKYSTIGDSTLWAHWKAKTYNVHTSSSEGFFSVNSSGTFDSELSISFTGSGSDGYILKEPRISIYAGTSATGSPLKVFEGSNLVNFRMGEMSNGKYYSDILITATCDKEARTILVKFDGNGGEPSQNTKNVTYDSPYGELPTATRTGYDLSGWFTYSSGGEEVTKDTIVKATQEHTLYAHWTAKMYTVSFDSQGGLSVSDIQVAYDSTYDNLPVPTRVGYDFAGWVTSGGTQITYLTKVSIIADQTLYAHWTANTYTVRFDSQGGSSVNAIQVVYDSTYGDLLTPTRVGYDFAGWFTSGGTQITSSTKVSITANQTLYAHWTAKTYDVTTNATLSAISVETNGTYASPLAISWEPVHPLGYTSSFKSATVYPIESPQTILTNFSDNASVEFTMNGAYYTNVVVDVVYTNTPNRYTVKFDLSGVSGEEKPIEAQYDRSFPLPMAPDKGETLLFKGWAKDASASEPEWNVESIRTKQIKNLVPSGEITLYAIWDDNRSDLSKAAHAEGIELDMDWGADFIADGKGIKSTGFAGLLGGSLQGPGKLEFLWKVEGDALSFEFTLGTLVENKPFSEIGGTNVGDGWKRVVFEIPDDSKLHAVSWGAYSNDDHLYLDKIIYTPTTTIEPTEADRRDISAVSMENGELAISFTNADDRFAYSLHGTNELTAARALWPVLWTTNGTGTITIKPGVKPGEPKYFYYLEVHSK